MNKLWTKELAFEKALKFDNRRDFLKNYSGAYEYLRLRGYLDDACKHMINLRCLSKWTYENCVEDVKLYQTKAEYRKKNFWGYEVARRNGWLDAITSHMIKQKVKRPSKWTREMCQEEALKYTTRIDFSKNSSKAYKASCRKHWIMEICSHMGAPNESKIKWNFEKCKEFALKYKHRDKFHWGDRAAYQAAFVHGWLNEICQHMTPAGGGNRRCIYSYEFSDNHVYVGLTYNINMRDKSRRYEKNDAVVLHIKKTGLTPILKQLTEYIPVGEAAKLERVYLENYVNDGWIKLNRIETGGIGGYGSMPRWNLNRIKKITSQYDNLASFMADDMYLYEIVKKNKWVDSLFPNEI